MSGLDRTAIPGNVLDRLLDVERRLDDLMGYAAMPTVDPEAGEGETTYVEIIREGDTRFVMLNGGNQTLWIPNPAGDATQHITGHFNLAGAAYEYKIGGAHALSIPGTGNLLAGEGAGAVLEAGGVQNVFLGYNAGFKATTGDDNVAVGQTAAHELTTGTHNTVMGSEAGYYLDTGTYNTAIGYLAGQYINDANYGTFVGAYAGEMFRSGGVTAADYNTAMGYGAAKYWDYGQYNVVIGAEAGGSAIAGDNTLNQNTVIGYRAGYALDHGANYNTIVGAYAGLALTTGGANVIIGDYAGYGMTSGDASIVIGMYAAYAGTVNSSIVIGYDNLAHSVSSVGDIIIGYNAVGDLAYEGTSNILIGYAVADNAVGASQWNVIIGATAGEDLTTGSENVLLGLQVAQQITSATRNNAMGTNALRNLGAGDRNTAIGNQAGYSVAGTNYNTYIGAESGFGAVAANNTALGAYSAYNADGGSGVFLGFQAGYYETGAAKLFIDNAQRASEADGRIKALIYGVFAAATADQYVTFNANVTVTEVLQVDNQGLHIFDTNASHDLIIAVGSDLDADYILTLTTGNSARTLDLGGNLTIGAATTISTGGTIALGGFTLTVPATGTAALLNQSNSFTLINPLITIAESWIGPSATAGVYFKGGYRGLGTITPLAPLHIYDTAAAHEVFVEKSQDTAGWGPSITYRRRRGAGNVSDGDLLGSFSYEGYHTGAYVAAASIGVSVDGAPGAGSMPAGIAFSTSHGANPWATPRMRIKGNGNVLMGANLTDTGELLRVHKVGGSQLGLYGGAADYATFAVQADGELIITTVDADAALADITLNPDGRVNINAPLIAESWGDSPFTTLDGLLLLGPGCPMTATSWTSLRSQAATLSGAHHVVNGRWPGTRALMVEEATTNLETNPSMELGDPATGYDDYNTPTRSQSSTYAKFGTYSQKVIADAANDGVSDTIAAVASSSYTFSVWVRADTNTTIYLHLVDQDDNSLVAAAAHAVGGTWQKFVLTAATGVGDTGIKGIVYASEASTFYIDGYQMEKRAYPTSTCIGSLSWCAWSGAADASTSTRVVTECNLDAYASLLSDNDTWSLSLWWQPQYDADADWPDNALLFDMRGDAVNRVYIEYEDLASRYEIWINGVRYIASASPTFKAGDWEHVLLTLDFANDIFTFYTRGAEDGSDDTALVAPTAVTQMNVGTGNTVGDIPNAAYSEFALFDSVLTAAEAAAMYETGHLLTDQGATQTPSLAGINVPSGMVYELPAISNTLAGLGTAQTFTAAQAIYKVGGSQLSLYGGVADYATFAVAADGAMTIATVDADAALANIILAPDGYVVSNARIGVGLTPTANMLGVSIEDGLLTLKETTTPTADTNYGKIYTKADNLLYFQTGDGVEHLVTFTT